MTRDQAHDVAASETLKNNAAYVVYRFPAWPAHVFSVVPEARGLPPTAVIVETVHAPRTGSLF